MSHLQPVWPDSVPVAQLSISQCEIYIDITLLYMILFISQGKIYRVIEYIEFS